jgi:hypothetical protein
MEGDHTSSWPIDPGLPFVSDPIKQRVLKCSQDHVLDRWKGFQMARKLDQAAGMMFTQ